MEASNVNAQTTKYRVGRNNVSVIEIRDRKKIVSRHEIMPNVYYVYNSDERQGFWYTTSNYLNMIKAKFEVDFSIGDRNFPFGAGCDVNFIRAFFITQLGTKNEGDIARLTYEELRKTVKIKEAYPPRTSAHRHKNVRELQNLHDEFEKIEKEKEVKPHPVQRPVEDNSHETSSGINPKNMSLAEKTFLIESQVDDVISGHRNAYTFEMKDDCILMKSTYENLHTLAYILQINIDFSAGNIKGQFLHFKFGRQVRVKSSEPKSSCELFITGGGSFENLKKAASFGKTAEVFEMILSNVLRSNYECQFVRQDISSAIHDKALETVGRLHDEAVDIGKSHIPTAPAYIPTATASPSTFAKPSEKSTEYKACIPTAPALPPAFARAAQKSTEYKPLTRRPTPAVMTKSPDTVGDINRLGVIYTDGGKRIEFRFFLKKLNGGKLYLMTIFANKEDAQKAVKYGNRILNVIEENKENIFTYNFERRDHYFTMSEVNIRFLNQNSTRLCSALRNSGVDLSRRNSVMRETSHVNDANNVVREKYGSKTERHNVNFVITSVDEYGTPAVMRQ